jgi:hypothetical protein
MLEINFTFIIQVFIKNKRLLLIGLYLIHNLFTECTICYYPYLNIYRNIIFEPIL